MAEEYCAVGDLMLGDLTFSSGSKDRFTSDAHDEVNEELGYVYVLPLGPKPFTPHVDLILKRTTALIASGRLILDSNAVGENLQLHAYGLSLLNEGRERLAAIRMGTIALEGIVKNEQDAADGNGLSIIPGDAYSGVETFYSWINDPWGCPIPAGGAPIWTPGR